MKVEGGEPDHCWLVIRIYRGNRRVISIHDARSEAETMFAEISRDLHDGDVILVSASLKTLEVVSGGYNRTRW